MPNLVGTFVGTSYSKAYDNITAKYPELAGLSIQFHMTDAGGTKGCVVSTSPQANSVISGTLDVYIQQ